MRDWPSVFFSSAFDCRNSASNPVASSESFFACNASSVESSLANVRSARSASAFVSTAATRSLAVTSSLLTLSTMASISRLWMRSRMSCAAFTMAVTVDGALGM